MDELKRRLDEMIVSQEQLIVSYETEIENLKSCFNCKTYIGKTDRCWVASASNGLGCKLWQNYRNDPVYLELSSRE